MTLPKASQKKMASIRNVKKLQGMRAQGRVAPGSSQGDDGDVIGSGIGGGFPVPPEFLAGPGCASRIARPGTAVSNPMRKLRTGMKSTIKAR